MQERRLSNVINLVYSTVNILDSKRIQQMTEISVRDSAAMKRITYLSMVFLPASLVANIFGMNVKEIVSDTNGTILHYILTVIVFTLVVMWTLTAYQSKSNFQPGMTFWQRLGWPLFFCPPTLWKGPICTGAIILTII